MRSRTHKVLPVRNVLRIEPQPHTDHSELILGKLSWLALGIAAGAVAMFFFDAVSGDRRRALVRDKLVGVGHDAAYLAQAKSKRAVDHLKGLFVTRRLDRVTRSEPQSDQQLHDRIRARLGRVVSHPRSVHVEVKQGRVTLTGHILTEEVEKLLNEVKSNVGVMAVDNQLVCHDSAQDISELQGHTEPRGREQRREAVSAMHAHAPVSPHHPIMSTMSTMSTEYFQEWRTAHKAACEAEKAVLYASLSAIDGRGEMPREDEIRQSQHLRNIANDLFRTAMEEMVASAAGLKHY